MEGVVDTAHLWVVTPGPTVSTAPTNTPIALVVRVQTVADVAAWYAAHARDLPWRRPAVTPWGVLVSEIMLQQTPVGRVEGPWIDWLQRWPTPAALAAEPVGEAVRAWGRLGYPRRAQRLHAAASAIVERFNGHVPDTAKNLRLLPGVGEYTAAAVASFAFGRREVVLDVNVRRVLSRLAGGVAEPPPSLTRVERARAQAWLPDEPADAARWAVASMELGAQVCIAGVPRCEHCPVSGVCAWLDAGRPPATTPGRRPQTYAGTDRQCRGVLLAVLRESDEPVGRQRVLDAWTAEPKQAERALVSLLHDGLVRLDSAGDLTL